ncbi:hypothetical protein [Nonomuraea dietziae]
MPADQLGGTGLRQADSLLLSIPLAGTHLSAFLFRGDRAPPPSAPPSESR